jgi:UDP-glucose 4-epimerase
MKNILLLGGNGYIGSRLMLNFGENFKTTIVDLNWFSEKECQVTDFNHLSKKQISEYDVVILLAGHSSVKMCQNNRLSSFNNNVRNFVNLLEKLSEKQKFLYASSSSVYGDTKNKIVDEKYDSFVPNNYYDLTKQIIDLYAIKSNLNYYGLRFGTVNGWSPNLRNDVMINSMIDSCVKDGHIKLYVKNTNRPILGIHDLTRAIKCIITSDEDHPGIYNLASFNSTAEEISRGVSSIINKPVVEYDTDKIKKITNEKMQTNAYNFSIDSTKFQKNYNFTFHDTIESITEELISKYEQSTGSSRREDKKYE